MFNRISALFDFQPNITAAGVFLRCIISVQDRMEGIESSMIMKGG